MMDLIDDPAPGQNAPEFTVSEISGAVKRVIEGEFGRVRIRGEVGRTMLARSGHLYFDLKDDRAVIASVSWKGQVAKMRVRPEEGMEVVATGRLTTFPGQSKYQLIVDEVAPAGVGALMAMLEKRKAQLGAEGLFAPDRKRPLPFLPKVIGVVTSPQGAVIRDILHRLRDRFPRQVLVWPVAVQGDRCAPEVTRAIKGFNALQPGGPIPRPDLLIVARGGGSLEDLWGFNEEAVVRAAADSAIPLISAVGHETDTTLIDYASDLRAPTPTAAAEQAVPVRLELIAGLDGLGARLSRSVVQGISQRQQRVRDLSRSLPRAEELVSRPAQRLDGLTARLQSALHRRTDLARAQVTAAQSRFQPSVLLRLTARKQDILADRTGRLQAALPRQIRFATGNFQRVQGRLSRTALSRKVAFEADRLNRAVSSLTRTAKQNSAQWRDRLQSLERMRQTLGYRETLARGYAVVRDDAGRVVTQRSVAEQQPALRVEFADGEVRLNTGDSTSAAPPQAPPVAKPSPKPARKAPRSASPDDQGSLF